MEVIDMQLCQKPYEERSFGRAGIKALKVATGVHSGEYVEVEGYSKGKAPNSRGTYDAYILVDANSGTFSDWNWVRVSPNEE